MVPYATFSYPITSLLIIATIILFVCSITPIMAFKEDIVQSVVERLRQD